MALLGLMASPNSPNREFNPLLAVHPPPSHTHPLPPIYLPLILATHDTNSGCEKVAQNPAVLVSYIPEIVIKH